MSEGGIYDHLGGGFSRYSVDERWLVPHFEKMLYDNAQLLELLALAFQRSGNPLFAERARETVGWLVREMTTKEGAFAASLDADSEGEEGKFYVWSLDEVAAALGADAADFAAQYDVTRRAAISKATISSIGSMAYRATRRPASAAGADAARMAMLRGKLLEIRDKRVRPGLDDKVLADWNGLMIAALVNAAVILEEPSWLALARARLRLHRRQHDARRPAKFQLGHSWRDGKLLFPGLASDFAAMIRAALALFEATGERVLLDQALAWQRALDAHYADADSGGYYLTADDAGDLLLRPHSTADDATPNPNAVAAGNLVRLAALTGDHAWREQADRLLEGILAAQSRNLFGHVALLNALDLRLRAAEIVCVGRRRRALRAGCAEAALSRPHRAARRQRRRSAGLASGAGEAEGRAGQRGLRLRRRDAVRCR